MGFKYATVSKRLELGVGVANPLFLKGGQWSIQRPCHHTITPTQ